MAEGAVSDRRRGDRGGRRGGRFATPDLVVTAFRALSADRAKLPVEDVELVAGVDSKGSASTDIDILPELYAL
ncbi:hypothetical protein ACFQZ2_15270 [Streptomonospora algeriensis]|uniref:Thiolase N-terminal domain-containing protein n=1 Tax=Streptomonospora algeriensis TaxID=995084 RepID=A0ABW3BEZ3_9ACTN